MVEAADKCDRSPRNESEVPWGCLELDRKMGASVNIPSERQFIRQKLSKNDFFIS